MLVLEMNAAPQDNDKVTANWIFQSMREYPKECIIALLCLAVATLWGANMYANTQSASKQSESLERIVSMQQDNGKVQAENLRVQTQQTEVLRGIKDELRETRTTIGDHTRRIETIESKLNHD